MAIPATMPSCILEERRTMAAEAFYSDRLRPMILGFLNRETEVVHAKTRQPGALCAYQEFYNDAVVISTYQGPMEMPLKIDDIVLIGSTLTPAIDFDLQNKQSMTFEDLERYALRTNLTMPQVISRCRRLERLVLANSTVTKKELTELLEAIPFKKRLKVLKLNFCTSLTRISSQTLKKFSNLEMLNLMGCSALKQAPRLSDLPKLRYFLMNRGEHLRNRLDVSGCPELECLFIPRNSTRSKLDQIIQACARLKLFVYGSIGINTRRYTVVSPA
jgi:hypothetical protein